MIMTVVAPTSTYIAACDLLVEAAILSMSISMAISSLVEKDDGQALHCVQNELRVLRCICYAIRERFSAMPVPNANSTEELQYWQLLETLLKDCKQTIGLMNCSVAALSSRTISTLQNVLGLLQYTPDGIDAIFVCTSRYFQLYHTALQVALETVNGYIDFTAYGSINKIDNLREKYQSFIDVSKEFYNPREVEYSDCQISKATIIQKPSIADVVIKANTVFHLTGETFQMVEEMQINNGYIQERVRSWATTDCSSFVSSKPATSTCGANNTEVPGAPNRAASYIPRFTPLALIFDEKQATEASQDGDSMTELLIEIELIDKICHIASDLYSQGKYNEAEPYFRKILIASDKVTLQHYRNINIDWIQYCLAFCLYYQEKDNEAESATHELRKFEVTTKNDEIRFVESSLLLADIYIKKRDWETAYMYGYEALISCKKNLGKEDLIYHWSLEILSRISEGRGDKVEAAAYRAMIPPDISKEDEDMKETPAFNPIPRNREHEGEIVFLSAVAYAVLLVAGVFVVEPPYGVLLTCAWFFVFLVWLIITVAGALAEAEE